jgi:hypothetical protein
MDSYANTKLDICHSGGRGTEWDENALSEKRFDKTSITHNKPETLMKTECIFFLFWLVLATASVEEPGEKMIGATFEQEFPKEGVLTAKVTEYTPPKNNKGADLADVCGSLARHTARHTARYTARHTARYTARDHSVRTFSLPACLVPPLVPGRRKTTEISSTVQMNSTYAKRK